MGEIRTGYVTQLGMEHRTAIRKAGEFGFDYVEVMMDGATERRRLTENEGDVRSLLDEYDLDLLVHLPFRLDIGSPFEHVREGAVRELEEAIRTAAELGGEKGVVHASSNAWPPAWEGGTIHTHILDSIRRLDEFATEREFEICVENIPDGFFGIHDFESLFEETDASMTLDTGHARIDGFDSAEMATFAGEHADRISHFHLNDTRMPKDEHLPFGSGTIEFERIFDALKREDWTGTLSIETFTFDYEYIEISKKRLDELL